MKRAYVDLSYGQMHYRHAGTGSEVLILLHMSGSSSDEYEKVGELLSHTFSVYAPDLFGFGNSDRPDHYLSFIEHRDAVIEFMDALDIEKACFAGNLVGSNICAHIAAAFPERVLSMVLFHPCYNPDPDYYKRARYGPVFAKIDLSDDGSHLTEIWARSAKYGESKEITDARAVCLHKAGDWGETLHWALCEDEGFEKVLKMNAVPVKMFGYGKLAYQNVELASKKTPHAGFELLPARSPYYCRALPEEAAGKLLSFFKQRNR